MANRDMTPLQFSFEKARKTIDCHAYFGSTGAVTLDGPGSKGVLSITKVTQLPSPLNAGVYTIALGWAQGTRNFVDTYIKALVLDNVPEIEYSGSTNPAATATMGILRDDINNNLPTFGDNAPTNLAATDGGTGGNLSNAVYYWLVTACDAFGNETSMMTSIAGTGETTATPTASHKETLTWSAVPGATSYNLYRSASSGSSGGELVFVGNTTALTLTDAGTAGTATYQGGTLGGGGSKTPNMNLPAYNFARPPMGYGAVTVVFLSGTTPTAPAAGEGMRIQIELGDSGAP